MSPGAADRLASRYDRVSWIYSLNAALGSATSRRALELAALRPGERVLELGSGTGRDAIRMAHAVRPGGTVRAIDLSAGMLAVARARLARSGLGDRVTLHCADARRIPFPDASFDAVFASRILDVVPSADAAAILTECRRVLVPGGRLVLAHMSKPGPAPSWFERLCDRVRFVGDTMFVARPVRVEEQLAALGFQRVRREYHRTFPVGTEIVTGAR